MHNVERMASEALNHRFNPRLLPHGPTTYPPHRFPWLPRPSIMNTQSQRQEWRDSALSSLNVAIEFLDLAKEISSITPAKAVFGSVSVLLAMIRVRFSSAMRCFVLTHNQDSMANELDYVELGLSCADICRALDRGMNGRRLDEFSQSVRDAMGQLTA